MNLTKAKETKTRVCCLYRVSTKGQVDKAENDIPMQKKACHEFAESKGWTIIKEHAELGVSGFKVAAADRDELQEIKREAEKQEFDILLVFMFDRLGRKDNETPFVLKWFVEQGISVWSTVEGEQRFDSNVDDLLNYIRFWQASSESQKTSVLEGYHKSAEGKHPKRDRIEKRITGCLQCGSMTRDLRKKR